MKFLKKIAFGTMTSALLLFNTVNTKADSLSINLNGGGHIWTNPKFFGVKPKDANATTTADNKAKDPGVFDALGLHGGGKLDYGYGINEYFEAGVSVGAGWVQNAMEVQGKKKGKASMGLLQVGLGLNLVLLPLGEQTLIIKFIPKAIFNLMGSFSNEAEKTTVGETKEEKISENTKKALKTINFGFDLVCGYDFRDMMDFPLFLGLELGITSMTELFNKKDGEKNNKILGREVTDNKFDQPGLGFKLGVNLGFDAGYYLFS